MNDQREDLHAAGAFQPRAKKACGCAVGFACRCMPTKPAPVPIDPYPMEGTLHGQTDTHFGVQPLAGGPVVWVLASIFNVQKVVEEGSPKYVGAPYHRKAVVLVTRKPKPERRPFLGVSA